MNYPIKTNQLIANFDYSKIDELYDIYKITNEKGFSKSPYILDSPVLENSVLSVCYTLGQSFYILLKKKLDNKEVIKSIIENSSKSDELTFERVDSTNVYRNILLQLFFNALKSPKSEILSFNNLTGHLYVFHPELIQRRKFKGKSVICQIPCIDFKVDIDLSIQLRLTTFTSLRYKKQLECNKIDELPKYALSFGNSFRRKLKDDKEDVFVIRQFPGKKNEIPFLDMENLNKFSKSKIGLLEEIISLFNSNYSDIIQISFKEIYDYNSIDYTRKKAVENEKAILNCLNKKNIRIVDLVDDKYSKGLIDYIVELFKNKYNINVIKSETVLQNSYNICVIHNKEYYDGVNDPHDIKYKNTTVQHVTLEDFADNAQSALSTIVHEILIKEDLNNRKITLFDWEKMNFDSKMTFAKYIIGKDVDRYFFMDIEKDGSFTIKEEKLDLINMSEHIELINAFNDGKKRFDKFKDLVMDSIENINIIHETPFFTIPEMKKIKFELSNGNTYLRNKEMRDELISSCTETKYYVDKNEGYYFSGVIGNGMRAKITNSANIRRIEAYNNSDLFFEDILNLMSVTFVRNNQLTVMPFPFKYLNEFINQIQK